jgi:hypothetical protein
VHGDDAAVWPEDVAATPLDLTERAAKSARSVPADYMLSENGLICGMLCSVAH